MIALVWHHYKETAAHTLGSAECLAYYERTRFVPFISIATDDGTCAAIIIHLQLSTSCESLQHLLFYILIIKWN